MKTVSLAGFAHWLSVYLSWYQLSLLPLLAAVVLGLVRYRYLSPALRALTLLTCFELVVEVSMMGAGYALGSNLFLYPVALVGESAFLLLLYGRALQSARFWRVAPYLLGALTIVAVLDGVLHLHTTTFYPSIQVLANLLMLGLAILYFRRLLNELHVPLLGRDPLFWISTVLVLIALSDLLLSLCSSYMLAHYSLSFNKQVWHIHSALLLLLYSTYLLALWMRPPKPSFSSY